MVMKTLADFKRRIQVGVLMETTRHHFYKGRDENGQAIFEEQTIPPRVVSIVQSNSFALQTKTSSGESVNSWVELPKAGNVSFDNNSCTIWETQQDDTKIKVLTYKFI